MKTKNLTGTKIGSWTVGDLIHKRTGDGVSRRLYECVCDCGTRKVIWAQTLYGGRTRMCRVCLDRTQSGSGNPRWTGHEELTGYIWSRVVTFARQRSIAVEMTIQEAWSLYIAQDRRCALTGVDIGFTISKGRPNGTASLDRIDSTGPYVVGNVQWVHKDVNLMKREMTQERFIKICRLVAAHTEIDK